MKAIIILLVMLFWPSGTIATANTSDGEFQINIKTFCIENAGTDADVAIIVSWRDESQQTHSQEWSLNTPRDDFEFCQLDTFQVSGQGMTTIDRIQFRVALQEGSADKNRHWYPDWVKIRDTRSGMATKAICQTWIYPGLTKDCWIDR